MKSRGRARAALVAAAGHLGCVVLGALHIHLGAGGPGSRALARYSAISGADSAYGFFAPEVSALPWAIFEVTEASGKVTVDTLETGANREADIRVKNVVGLFWDQGSESLRRSLVASWAGKMFARHPGAESVVVEVRSYDLPSMEGIRDGQEPRWIVHYRAKLVPQEKLQATRGTP